MKFVMYDFFNSDIHYYLSIVNYPLSIFVPGIYSFFSIVASHSYTA